MAYNYASKPDHPTPEEHKAVIDFFTALQKLLPCKKCAKHYTSYMRAHPITADSRADLVDWVYKLHSDVNRREKKPNLSKDEVDKIYAGWSANDVNDFVNTSVNKRLRRMADPHNNKPIVHGVEEMLGIGESLGLDKIIGLLLFGAVVGGVVYYAKYVKKKEETEAPVDNQEKSNHAPFQSPASNAKQT